MQYGESRTCKIFSMEVGLERELNKKSNLPVPSSSEDFSHMPRKLRCVCRSEGSRIIKLERGWQNRILTTHTTYKAKGMDLFVLKPHKLLEFHLKVQTKGEEKSLCVHLEETTIIPLMMWVQFVSLLS